MDRQPGGRALKEEYVMATTYSEALTKQKTEGQYMTPAWVVDLMLDEAGFKGPATLSMKVIEPCFGDGAFLSAIFERMFEEGNKEGMDTEEIVDAILHNIYGVEKDPALYAAAIERLDKILEDHGARPVDWSSSFYNEDIYNVFDGAHGMFDLCIGNPPYIRVHHMSPEWREVIRQFHVFDIGNAYTAFYVFGFHMLNENGRLVYISPNGFMRNSTDHVLRDFILRKGLLKKIYDFRSSKIFPGVSACVCICSLDRNLHRESPLSVQYSEYDSEQEISSVRLNLSDMREKFPDGHPWNLGEEHEMSFVKDNRDSSLHLGNYVESQSGIATIRDNIYIFSVYEDEDVSVPYYGVHTQPRKTVYLKNKDGQVWPIESDILHRCIKESRFMGTYDNRYILFPYSPETDGMTYTPEGDLRVMRYVPMKEETFTADYPLACAYLESYRATLAERTKMSGQAWFLFGRSQGVANSCFRKLVFKHIMNRESVAIQPFIVDEDVVVTNGFFTTVLPEMVIRRPQEEGSEVQFYDEARADALLTEVATILQSDEFARYCALIGKNKSGGYIEITSKMVKGFGVSSIEL